MIRVIATFLIKPESIDEALSLATELVTITRTEKGCAQYDFVRSTEQQNKFVMLEGWESKADLDSHSAAEHFTRLVPQLAALCEEPPTIDSFTQVI